MFLDLNPKCLGLDLVSILSKLNNVLVWVGAVLKTTQCFSIVQRAATLSSLAPHVHVDEIKKPRRDYGGGGAHESLD